MLWHERSTDCIYWLCVYVSKRRMDETSEVCDRSTHSRIIPLLDSREMLHKYITYTNISVPCYYRRYTQRFAYVLRHSIICSPPLQPILPAQIADRFEGVCTKIA
jgi:hypothetical protein